MSEGGPSDPLTRLDQRLKRAQVEQQRERQAEEAAPTPSGLGLGFRIGVELLASLLVGLGLGWVIDHFFGTRPWGLIAFFFIGAAAGMMNAFRAAQGMGRGRPQ
ncbi:MAG TPA: AtpZ/AtpI family protein [Stellaceae bacterium]|nr:AtpZ/AtpI family protein [Stellaceae bacterium]